MDVVLTSSATLRAPPPPSPCIVRHSESTVSIWAPVWLTDTPRIPFPLSGGRCLCVRGVLYAGHKKPLRLNPLLLAAHTRRQQFAHTHTHTLCRPATSTKARMSPSSLERISGLGLCVHAALSARLFTFVSIHIKAFFFSGSFTQPANMTHCRLYWFE